MSSPYPPQPPKKLERSKSNRILGGVCAGVANYLNMDPTLVRVLTVVISLFTGVPVILYIVALVRDARGRFAAGPAELSAGGRSASPGGAATRRHPSRQLLRRTRPNCVVRFRARAASAASSRSSFGR